MLADPAGPAQDLLATLIARYDEPDVAGGHELPARRYVGHGQPGSIAADEDDPRTPKGSLMVALVRVDTSVGNQQAPILGAVSTSSAAFQVRLLRPVASFGPGGAPPAAAEVTADSLVLAADAARIVDTLHAWAKALPAHFRVSWGAVEAISPQGMLAGNRVTATLGPL